MVAGATGIDLVAMVIAADEGIMPQTREHMEICTLLGIEHGLIALTKIDLVDEEWLELVLDETQDFTRGTFLEGAPVIPLSSATGQGLDEFREALDRLCKKIPERSYSGIFRLPVDRIFTMKGFGTVITGSLISGHIATGDTVMIYPSGITSKVRGIQAHNKKVDTAKAGMRTAINFQGIEKASISRGDVVSTPEVLEPSYMLDISVLYLASNKKPIKNRTRVRFHAGTSEILGNLILLDRDELAPGEKTVAQIRLDRPVTLVKDDRFVIRSYSPVRTIGGGQILNPIPKKHKRFNKQVVENLKSLPDKSLEDMILYHVKEAGYEGASFSRLRIMVNIPDKKLLQAVNTLLSKRMLILIDKEKRIFIHKDHMDDLKNKTLDNLSEYHKANPLKPGIAKEELKSKLPRIAGPKIINILMNQMIKSGEIIQEGEIIRLKSHKVSLGVDQADLKKKIFEIYTKSGLTPPYFKDICKNLKIDSSMGKDVLMILIEDGKIVKVKEELYFSSASIEKLKDKTVNFLKKQKEMTTPQFKEIAGVSRKYLIPLIEYFDSKNITIRVGDTRRLRSG